MITYSPLRSDLAAPGLRRFRARNGAIRLASCGFLRFGNILFRDCQQSYPIRRRVWVPTSVEGGDRPATQ